MNCDTIQDQIDAIQSYDDKLRERWDSLEREVGYRGTETHRKSIENRYIQPYLIAKEATNAGVVAARERYRARIIAIRARERRFLHSLSLCIFPSLKQRRRRQWNIDLKNTRDDYRSAITANKQADQKYRDMVSNIAIGPLAEEIEREYEQASLRHRIASFKASAAIVERENIQIERDRNVVLAGWLRAKSKLLKRDLPLVRAAQEALSVWISALRRLGQIGAGVEPVLRVERGRPGRDEFRTIVQNIQLAWKEGPYGLYRHAKANPDLVGRCIARMPYHNKEAMVAKDRAFEDFVTALEQSRNFDPEASAVLYWLAAAAEVALISDLPAKIEEEPMTTLLAASLRDSAKRIGTNLFSALGYGAQFPFSLAIFESTKPLEAENGADIGLIVHLALEDRTLTRAALLQAKIARSGTANVHRNSRRRGNNHQLAALLKHKKLGYYVFFDGDPVLGLPVVVASAESIERHLLAVHGRSDVTQLEPKQCNVEVTRDAVDFSTFVGLDMMRETPAYQSIDEAIHVLGGRKVEIAARKLMIIEMGRPPSSEVRAELVRLGYRETRKGLAISEMAASKERDIGWGR